MKLSVIIPFYDAVGSIAKTIRKGLLQTLENQTLSKKEFEVNFFGIYNRGYAFR